MYAFGLDNNLDFLCFNGKPPKIRLESDKFIFWVKYGNLKLTEKPKLGDYIFYRKGKDLNHVGIWLENNMVISKFGTEGPVTKHKLEDVFNKYGSEVTFYSGLSIEEISKLLKI